MDYWNLADDQTIEITTKALEQHGIKVFVVNNGQEAKKKLFEIIPEKAEVMDMSSVTLQTTGITQEIQESGKYVSVKKQLMGMDRKTSGREMQKIGAAPEIAVGSVHAITMDGTLMWASNTGSQLPAYAYGAGKVFWIVGTQKIVKDLNAGLDRIYSYCLPLEAERMKKAGGEGSNVNKILIINGEIKPDRLFLIFVKEKLGF